MQILSPSSFHMSGAYMIPYWVFRECAVELSEIVAYLFNQSLHSGKFPTRWKQAIVTPILKVKKVSYYTSIGDLRPISVTPILSRILEKVVVKKHLCPALDDELFHLPGVHRPLSFRCYTLYICRLIVVATMSGV